MKVISTINNTGKNHIEELCSEVGLTREELEPIVDKLTQAEDPHTGVFHMIVEDDYKLCEHIYS